MATLNPYETPKAVVADVDANLEAERIRESHINHEASIKAVGALYYLSAFFMAFGALVLVGGFVDQQNDGWDARGIYFALTVLLCAGLAVAGHGLRTLKKWTRIPVGILSGLGLLGFPLGTLINGYILWLVFSKQGRLVFSDEYARVIAATPHVRYRTSIVVWILVALLGLLLLVAIGAAVFR